MKWEIDHDLKRLLEEIVEKLEFGHIRPDRVHLLRANNSKTRAYARTWAFPRIFQHALNQAPVYIIEIISNNFDRLDHERKTQVLIHELMHIPRNFSGNLRPHKYGNKRIDKEVGKLYKIFRQK